MKELFHSLPALTCIVKRRRAMQIAEPMAVCVVPVVTVALSRTLGRNETLVLRLDPRQSLKKAFGLIGVKCVNDNDNDNITKETVYYFWSIIVVSGRGQNLANHNAIYSKSQVCKDWSAAESSDVPEVFSTLLSGDHGPIFSTEFIGSLVHFPYSYCTCTHGMEAHSLNRNSNRLVAPEQSWTSCFTWWPRHHYTLGYCSQSFWKFLLGPDHLD